ncbi:MAG TPA: IS4 family transposase [Anaerolineae bacterium]|nr:IS4 family transposase [Anaerolineae bacterium]
MRSWIEEEMGHVNLGDKRLNERLKVILEDISQSPCSSIPEACGSKATTKAAYRFFDSGRIDAEDIQEGFFISTARRTSSLSRVIVAQDTTDLDFSSHKKAKGIGYLDNKLTFGLKLHSALAIRADGVPLGLLYQKFWARDMKEYGKRTSRKAKSIDEKESYRWLEAVESIEEHIEGPRQVITVADRESDIYDLFAKERRSGYELLIRAAHNRATIQGRHLFETVSSLPVRGSFNLDLTRARDRKTRQVPLAVRFGEVTIKPPKHRRKEHLPGVKLHAILVKEIDASEPISWLLLTTLCVETLEDAIESTRLYSLRWLIERYHYTLKSGCQVEELQLEDAERIKRAVALYCIAAWRILFLTYLARTEPDQSSERVFEKHEWQALCCFVNKTDRPPESAPTLAEAVLLIAKLGGFLGRRQDGDPGVKVLWRGMKRLNDISQAYLIFNRDVGNE